MHHSCHGLPQFAAFRRMVEGFGRPSKQSLEHVHGESECWIGQLMLHIHDDKEWLGTNGGNILPLGARTWGRNIGQARVAKEYKRRHYFHRQYSLTSRCESTKMQLQTASSSEESSRWPPHPKCPSPISLEARSSKSHPWTTLGHPSAPRASSS
jgi:hypothetical protein